MKQAKILEIDESLLLRYFNGEVGEDEIEQIERWIKTSEENRELARGIHYIAFVSSSLRNLRKPCPDYALNRVKRQIDRNSRQSVLRRFQRIAAVLILPLFILSCYFIVKEFKEQPAKYVEMRMNPGMIGSVVLPDGSKVWLNSDSYLRYPDHFSKHSREVLIDGEAYFSITKDMGKKFIVHSRKDQLKIEVLGTEFNMDAYEENDLFTTTLVSGSIRLSYQNENHEERTLVMKPEDKVEYNKDKGLIRKKRADVDRDISWREGTIILKNTPLKEVLWTLSKRFNVEFEIKNKALESSSFTGIFKNQQLERILEHLKIASNINYSIQQEVGENNVIKKKRVTLY